MDYFLLRNHNYKRQFRISQLPRKNSRISFYLHLRLHQKDFSKW